MLTKKDKQGLWLFAAVAVALVALFAVKIQLDGKPKAGLDNCIGQVVANTVFLLDHSEQIPEQTREEIAARAMSVIRDKVKVNERVSIFTISDLSKNSLKPLVSLCRPPDGGNRAIENVQLIRKRFQQNFEQPIRSALLIAPGDAKESPIAQALIDISLSQYLRGTTNSLVIFSDMLENSSKFSLYRCTSATDTISTFRESRRGAQERPEFKNTLVTLNIIPRLNQSKESLRCRDQLWSWFFGNNPGAQAGLTTDYLPGGNAVGPEHMLGAKK